jgi:hypothetical protein
MFTRRNPMAEYINTNFNPWTGQPAPDPPEEKQRTLTQNACLHRYCREVAKDLREAGLDIEHTMKHLEIPWTEVSVKELMAHTILAAMYPDVTSTADLTTV